MSYSTREEFEVLHGLRVRGLCQVQSLAESTGKDVTIVGEVLDGAITNSHVRHRSGGRVQGYLMTADGRERHDSLRKEFTSPTEIERLTLAYKAFLNPNREFKSLMVRWQTEANGDPSLITAALDTVHDAVADVLETASSALARMKFYLPRLDAAIAAFRRGDTSALTKPMSGSYHDIWMELHEDFLITLGKSRSGADE